MQLVTNSLVQNIYI